MNIGNIKDYFDGTILRRGYNYYKESEVFDVYEEDSVIYANVNRARKYRVSIDFNDVKLKMNCTCPYAERDNCKRMADLFYYIKNDGII